MRVFCGLKVVAEYGDLDPATKTVKGRHAVNAELDDLDPAKWAELMKALTDYLDAQPPKGDAPKG